MPREQRVQLLREISQRRGAAIITYITGDRENLSTRIAPDVIRVFRRHLESIGHHERIDLFLYTRGGDVLTPWRLVNLIREYTPYFSVLVPFRAYSAGTLICLGADEIVMGKMGELGPIDPSVANAFNPPDPGNPTAKIPVSVEDVSAYLALARDKAKLYGEEQLSEVFAFLSEKVHPLALGNVHRNYLLIRSIAKKLLNLHLNTEEEYRVKDIIDHLTEKLYAHNHMISRQEAEKDIKLQIVKPDPILEKALWSLFEDYEEDLNLLTPFTPLTIAQGPRTDFEINAGFIETIHTSDAFVYNGQIESSNLSDGTPHFNVNITQQNWRPIQ